MSQVTNLSPELVRGVSALSRALVAAVRNWTLYPPSHPASAASLERLARAIEAATSGAVFSVGVTPDALLIEGIPVQGGQTLVEAAALLHDRDIIELTFVGAVPAAALHSLLTLLTLDAGARRARGGPEQIWSADGHHSVVIRQIDYLKVLEDREVATASAPADLWRSLVQSIVEGRKALDELAQRRLLEIAGDPAEIGALATAVMAPQCAADGSPMITSQAAIVLAAFRHLANIVAVMDPQRSSDVMRNLASATASLDPHVVMQMMRTEDDPSGGVAVVQRMAAAFDDVKVAQLLATALATDGQASERLAAVFHTIAPDAERKRRVLNLTRSLLSEASFAAPGQFKALWSSMEELLISYDDRPFVSEQYRVSLDGAGGRADRIAARDLPEELDDWVRTLGQENVRSLSVILLIDLLRLERDAARAAEIAGDAAALAEDLLLSGDYLDALAVARALAEAAANVRSIAREACARALDGLAQTSAMSEAIGLLGELDVAEIETFTAFCAAVGPAAVDTLQVALKDEAETPARSRASAIIAAFAAAGVPRLAPLIDDERWFVKRNAAELLGRIAAPEGVPLLQALLRQRDPRVTRQAIVALAGINNPAAARAIHTVLRAATGDLRQAVITALVEGRDPRVVPMLIRILNESEPLGKDHVVVLDTLGALEAVGTDEAVPSVAAIMRRRSWVRRTKARALKRRAVGTLVRIGSAAATTALDEAAAHGDRVLRKIVREIRL